MLSEQFHEIWLYRDIDRILPLFLVIETEPAVLFYGITDCVQILSGGRNIFKQNSVPDGRVGNELILL